MGTNRIQMYVGDDLSRIRVAIALHRGTKGAPAMLVTILLYITTDKSSGASTSQRHSHAEVDIDSGVPTNLSPDHMMLLCQYAALT